MLEAVHLTKCYAAVPAVQAITFRLAPGQVLGCLGPNGSGKSTTVKMLTGLLQPTRGKVLFQGRNIQDDLVSYRKRLGYVPEEPNLYPYLTGREYLEMVGLLRGMSRPHIDAKINDLLELFAMHAHRHASIASYSKGMRQRILLISALIHDPALLIFDEPLSGLDVTTALVLKNLIKALGEQGRTIFYCSHVLEVVEQVCTHVMILRHGEVIAFDHTAAIRNAIISTSLESTFMQLVDEVDTQQVARDVIAVMEAN